MVSVTDRHPTPISDHVRELTELVYIGRGSAGSTGRECGPGLHRSYRSRSKWEAR